MKLLKLFSTVCLFGTLTEVSVMKKSTCHNLAGIWIWMGILRNLVALKSH